MTFPTAVAAPANVVDVEGAQGTRTILTSGALTSYMHSSMNSAITWCAAAATAAKYSSPQDATETAVNAALDAVIATMNAGKQYS